MPIAAKVIYIHMIDQREKMVYPGSVSLQGTKKLRADEI